jgi:hypothetical protein
VAQDKEKRADALDAAIAFLYKQAADYLDSEKAA